MKVIDPFSQMKREYNTILDDADYANRNNCPISELYMMLSGNFSQGDHYLKGKLLNGTETSFRHALISNNCHLY